MDGNLRATTATGTRALVPVIMAGGAGTRLWPMSREMYPKQFLRLLGDGSLLQDTLKRLDGLAAGKPIVVCGETHRFLVAEQLRQISMLDRNILLEPARRNTAPAVALAALHAVANGEDPLLLVLAADHVIHDAAAFRESVLAALPFAADGELVTFGVVARTPETGYGYIRRGTALGPRAFRVEAFIEKPDRQRAQEYVESRSFDWNSGMFLFGARRFLDELEQWCPPILDACRRAMADVSADLDFVRVDAQAFADCPDDSVDYAVMEKTQRAVVVPIDVGWNDVGAFAAVWEASPKDATGNVIRGDVLTHDCHDNLLIAENTLVAAVGVDDIIVVQTKDAVLVTAKDRAQEVKQIVQQLRAAGRTEHELHREVHRPWGRYDSIDSGARYQVKRITVLPGARLSVQMHHHRAEHWIVVHGTARVTRDGEQQLLTENESIYLPVGSVHSLENPGKLPLELIEVQVGSYLGEDDIVRLEDRYGRV